MRNPNREPEPPELTDYSGVLIENRMESVLRKRIVTKLLWLNEISKSMD